MVFIASVEIAPLSGSQMEAQAVGAFVYCLIPAESQTIAKRMLKNAMAEDKYLLTKLEFLRQYEGFRWEKGEDQIEYDRLAKRAALNNEIVYGAFHTWKQDKV